ncbi:hypothetical protein BDN70DRAFT_860632 [Pholiota conissans]|uniref:Peroxisome membrane anchor protein Pex14p N-terminal domain-containing protein n=1 Tax=Pholiota conissans TaxID=109636 RepID=A0A9P5YYP1_9AGAR|nr:hypothetical protein BDN70DRAFT_860632 [Pholiota conissans]
MPSFKAESSSSEPPETNSSLISPESDPVPNDQTARAPIEATNNADLVDKARSFLLSPQIVHQDILSKRAFLREKGLNETQIDSLLNSLPSSPPSIPPRTYPRPPPSNLPVVLLGLTRLFAWLAGGSAVLLLLYRRFLFPKIAQTWLARHSLRSHHLMLMSQLNTSLTSLKNSQFESFSILPHSDPFKEPKQFSTCNSVAEILKVASSKEKEPEFTKLPIISLLRCGIKELGGEPTTEELFRFLEAQIPWLLTDEGLEFEQEIWDILCSCRLFSKAISLSSSSDAPPDSTPPTTQWKYSPPLPVLAPPLLQSLAVLSSELPKKDMKSRKSPFQHTLQSMSDFTGYLSTQVYLPYRPTGYPPNDKGQSTIEDELRREIRALKGLVLNRRSFMSAIPMPGVTSTSARTTP